MTDAIFGYCIYCGNRGRIKTDPEYSNICSECGGEFRVIPVEQPDAGL